LNLEPDAFQGQGSYPSQVLHLLYTVSAQSDLL
jgi:hypothetical protein